MGIPHIISLGKMMAVGVSPFMCCTDVDVSPSQPFGLPHGHELALHAICGVTALFLRETRSLDTMHCISPDLALMRSVNGSHCSRVYAIEA